MESIFLNFKLILKTICVSTGIAVLLWIIFLSLTPVISRDALILHMSFSRIWAEKGFFYYLDHNLSTLGMMNLNFIYTHLLRLQPFEELPKIFHASMLIGSGIAIYSFLKNRFGRAVACPMTLFFLTIPVNQRLASEAYVDLGVLFFSTISIIFFVKWIEKGRNFDRLIILSALFSGLATGTKYSAAILPMAIILIAGYSASRAKKSSLAGLKIMTVYSVIILLLISPWLIRNYKAVGNPLYPLLNSVFDAQIIRVETNLEPAVNEYATRRIQGESGLYIAAIPFRLFFSGRDNDFIGGFDGVLNPMLFLLFIPLLIPKLRRLHESDSIIVHLTLLFFLSLLLFLGYGHLRIRYFIYCIPVLIILNSYLIDILRKKIKSRHFFYASIALYIFCLTPNLIYSQRLFSRLGTYDYIFGNLTKEEYLHRKLPDYEVAQMINKHSPKESVIYQVLCGHRTYYIDRDVVFDDYILDRHFFNLIAGGAETQDYLKLLGNLPSGEHDKAHYLMIRPNVFANNYQMIFNESHGDSTVTENIIKFKEFLNSQPLVFDKDGIFVYQLIYGE
jgi:hypothetical protein